MTRTCHDWPVGKLDSRYGVLAIVFAGRRTLLDLHNLHGRNPR